MTAEVISIPRPWITPLYPSLWLDLPPFFIGDIQPPHHIFSKPWLKVKTEGPCLAAGPSLATLCSVILSPTAPPLDALHSAKSPALSPKRDTCGNSGSWHNEEQHGSGSMPWWGWQLGHVGTTRSPWDHSALRGLWGREIKPLGLRN